MAASLSLSFHLLPLFWSLCHAILFPCSGCFASFLLVYTRNNALSYLKCRFCICTYAGAEVLAYLLSVPTNWVRNPMTLFSE